MNKPSTHTLNKPTSWLIVVSLASLSLAARAAQISVTYKDIPLQAQQAFEKATTFWERCLISEAPIKIHVKGINKGPTGFAMPRMVRDKKHLGLSNTWYPAALANALSGRRDSTMDDMNIFMSLKNNWYYDTDDQENKGEKIKPQQTDYINVAVHEIAHGLGISSGSFIPWQGKPIGSIGYPNDYINFFAYTFELHELDGTPQVYDRFIKTADGTAITQLPNPSLQLASELRREGVYFDGVNATKAAGKNAQVTPGNISHIPKQEGKSTPIMLGDSGKGESIHQPDDILLGMLKDMGWSISLTCNSS